MPAFYHTRQLAPDQRYGPPSTARDLSVNVDWIVAIEPAESNAQYTSLFVGGGSGLRTYLLPIAYIEVAEAIDDVLDVSSAR